MKIIKISVLDKDIGAIGIGAMIVFIAMVLVAGIAASVLIQTSGKLETQAMKAGQETIAEVSTGLAIDKIYGYNESTASKVNYLLIAVRLRAGSSDVDISQTTIEISDSDTKNLFVYNSSVYTSSSDIDGDLFAFANFPYQNGTTFGVIVIEDADESLTSANPVLNVGDHVFLTVNTSEAFGGFTTRKDVFGSVMPEEGSSGVISFATPAAYNDAIIDLQ